MRVTLLQEMPDQLYQLALCRAKSIVAALAPLKVHFKNIEIHARKAPCHSTYWWPLNPSFQKITKITPPAVRIERFRFVKQTQEVTQFSLFWYNVSHYIIFFNKRKNWRHCSAFQSGCEVRWGYLWCRGWRPLWWSCWSAHHSQSPGVHPSRPPPLPPPSHSNIYQ